MSAHTPGPWKLIWWGNETYPYPLSVHTEDDENWIARDGEVSSVANAHLIAAAPGMLKALAVFAMAADGFDGPNSEKGVPDGFHVTANLNVVHLRAARAAYRKAKGGGAS